MLNYLQIGPLDRPLFEYAGNVIAINIVGGIIPLLVSIAITTWLSIRSVQRKSIQRSLPSSVIHQDQGQDMFVIEVYKDGSGRYMMLCYGFGWKGTYAAGKYFDKVIFPNISMHDESWIIVKWEDTNADDFVNNPGNGDNYTIIASG